MSDGIAELGYFHEVMKDQWELARALGGGTTALRKAGEQYLPRFENETEDNYQRRLTLASLTNFYIKAKMQMVGEMFREPVTYSDGTFPEEIIGNIDYRGSDLTQFCENIAEVLLCYSCGGILIDHPQASGVSAQEEQARGLRHYWQILEPWRIIDILTTFVDGVEEVIHIRWFEDTAAKLEERFEYGIERKIYAITRELSTESGRVILGPPIGEIWSSGPQDIKLNKTLRDSDFQPVQSDIQITGFDRIPFVPMQVNRTAFFQGRAPLADIAEKNIYHWRQSSNYGNILEISSFPMLVRFGAQNRARPDHEDPLPSNQKRELIVGPHVIMDMPALTEGTDARYLEPSGAAFEALEKALDRTIDEAELMAIDMLTGSVQKTATEANYDRLAAMAPLQRVASEVERGVNIALEMTAAARGRNENPGYITIDKDFGITASDALRIQALREARAAGDITREAYLRELKSIGALSASFDPAAEALAATANDDNLSGQIFGA